MDMSLPECAAQLGAALLTVQQLGELLEAAKFWSAGIGIMIGIVICSLFYEWRFFLGIAFQRQLDRPLRAVSRWKRIKAWSDRMNEIAMRRIA